ncbi:MAG: hypothetical protein ACFFC3_03195 [Candidatus Odinarchaeota archaeon]
MAKKDKKKKDKKKEKKEKPQEKKEKPIEKEREDNQIPEYSLDTALSSAKTTGTTLQTLLKGVSEEKGFVHPKKEGEIKITPQLTHESKSKIAEAYVMEDIPLTQRDREKKKPRTTLIPEKKEKIEISKSDKKIEEIKPSPSLEMGKAETPETSELQASGEKESLEKVEKIPSQPSTKKEPSFVKVKKENIYLKLTEFFEGLLASYGENYDRWEMSISNILAILRKMRKITKKNTDDLTISINSIFEGIQESLEQFKIKRNEIEKVAEVNIESMSGEFKRVLGLLELQIKEYQLKRVTDEFIHELKLSQ